jgi:VCBS repeat-containing protein
LRTVRSTSWRRARRWCRSTTSRSTTIGDGACRDRQPDGGHGERLTFTDVDLTDTHTTSAVAQAAGYLGSSTLGTPVDSTGGVPGSVGWNFSVADGALDFLAAGQTLVQSYNVTVDDGHGGTALQVVTVTITGTNDVPVITSTVAAAAGSVTELAGVTGSLAADTATGTLTFKDVDLTDTHTASAVAQAASYLGSVTLETPVDSTGGVTGSVGRNFSVAHGALDFLAAGQTLVQSYNVTVETVTAARRCRS